MFLNFVQALYSVCWDLEDSWEPKVDSPEEPLEFFFCVSRSVGGESENLEPSCPCCFWAVACVPQRFPFQAF